MEKVEKFFEALRSFKHAQEKAMESSEKLVALAASRPSGAKLIGSRFQDGEGRVWRTDGALYDSEAMVWIEVRRSGGHFSPYEDTDNIVREARRDGPFMMNGAPLKPSLEHPEEDWTWEIPVDSAGSGTKEVEEREVREARLGILFAECLLEQEAEIREWMTKFALKDNRKREGFSSHGDELALLRKFVPELKGEIRTADRAGLKAALSAALDAIAGVPEGTRHYLTC